MVSADQYREEPLTVSYLCNSSIVTHMNSETIQEVRQYLKRPNRLHTVRAYDP